jgi:hypothetical protein
MNMRERKDRRRKRRKENQMAGESKHGPGNNRMRLPLVDTGFSPGCHLWQFKKLDNQVWIYGESKPTLRCAGRQPLLTVHRAIYVLGDTGWAFGYRHCVKDAQMSCYDPPFQIVDEEGNVLPPGKEGNIAVRIKPTRPFCFFNCYLVSCREQL